MTTMDIRIHATAYECVECGKINPCMLCDINELDFEPPTYCPYDGSTLWVEVEQKEIGVSP